MARQLRLTPRFFERLRACGVQRDSDASAAVGATLSALSEAAQLPGLLDTVAAVPPTGRGLVRRAAGRNLWIWYHVTDDEVIAFNVTKSPPVPIDE